MSTAHKKFNFLPQTTIQVPAGLVPQDGTLCLLTNGSLAIRLSQKTWACLKIVGSEVLVSSFPRLNAEEVVCQTTQKVERPLRWADSIL